MRYFKYTHKFPKIFCSLYYFLFFLQNIEMLFFSLLLKKHIATSIKPTNDLLWRKC